MRAPAYATKPPRHLLSLAHLDAAEIEAIVDRAVEHASGLRQPSAPLLGKIIGLYFRKTSTRTRTSFAVATLKLGGSTLLYGANDLQIETGETYEDTGRVLSGYLDGLVIRTAGPQTEMCDLAKQNTMPVINAMSSHEHPAQALADLATLKTRFGALEGLRILYVGEGNNTASALAYALSRIRGVYFELLTPPGFALPDSILTECDLLARQHGAAIQARESIDKLPSCVDAVYTTRWLTTGVTRTDPNWRDVFRPFSVTPAMMDRVSKPSGTVFMHDLPAIRGEEVDDAVLDGPQSIAFQQARFKLFSAMAALEWCLCGF
ncbi:MAG: ornithine carbamoyltransferase [Blastocatellia bacterium]|nr:ornithine carbamoyltransferase [Blastocatellia bacterium]